MKLGVDLDGVVVNFATTANRWLANYCKVLPHDIDRWDWFTKYPDGEAAWAALWDEGVGKDHLFATAPPVLSAEYALKVLRRKHDIHFITYRPERTLPDTKLWLARRGLDDLPVTFTDDKTTVECDLYLDDHGPTIEALNSAGRRGVVFRQPWNAEWWLTQPSVGGWADFVVAIEGWA